MLTRMTRDLPSNFLIQSPSKTLSGKWGDVKPTSKIRRERNQIGRAERLIGGSEKTEAHSTSWSGLPPDLQRRSTAESGDPGRRLGRQCGLHVLQQLRSRESQWRTAYQTLWRSAVTQFVNRDPSHRPALARNLAFGPSTSNPRTPYVKNKPKS